MDTNADIWAGPRGRCPGPESGYDSVPRGDPRHGTTARVLTSELLEQIKARPVAAKVGRGFPATRPCTPVRNGDRAQGKEKSKSLNSLNSLNHNKNKKF